MESESERESSESAKYVVNFLFPVGVARMAVEIWMDSSLSEQTYHWKKERK